eukprot:scaffold1371_cov77-Skeletonema_dohrnii-CCMP3373.AAC.3
MSTNPVFRLKQCGFYLRDGKILPLTDVASTMITYVPSLSAAELGTMVFLVYLWHHIATADKFSKSTVDCFERIYIEDFLILRQHPGATSCTDSASKRFGCGVNTYNNTAFGRQPICEGTEHNRKRMNQLLNAILKFGHEFLGVELYNLMHTRYDIRGYFIGGMIGMHPDSPNALDTIKSRLRMFIKTGARTKIEWSLYEFDINTGKKPAVFRDKDGTRVPSLELTCPAGFSVYASTSFASGHIPLARNADKGDESFIIAYHEVEEVKDGRSITWVIDFFFDTVKGTMIALERIRQEQIHFDFNDTDTKYVDLYYSVSDTS